MNDLWKRLRRLATSFMLVAAFAFAFHNAAVAADITGAGGCNEHVHAASAHLHAEGAAHDDAGAGHSHARQHASTDHGNHAGKSDKDDCKVPCCGSACTTALLVAPAMPQIIRGPATTLTVLSPQAMDGVRPSGLKRPPRPPLTV